jgi:hypothetical protein
MENLSMKSNLMKNAAQLRTKTHCINSRRLKRWQPLMRMIKRFRIMTCFSHAVIGTPPQSTLNAIRNAVEKQNLI